MRYIFVYDDYRHGYKNYRKHEFDTCTRFVGYASHKNHIGELYRITNPKLKESLKEEYFLIGFKEHIIDCHYVSFNDFKTKIKHSIKALAFLKE